MKAHRPTQDLLKQKSVVPFSHLDSQFSKIPTFELGKLTG